MASAIDPVVEASVRALEYREAAWDADDRGNRCPDPSALSDPTLSAVVLYTDRDLPSSAQRAIQAEVTRRRVGGNAFDLWLPWATLGAVVGSGAVVVLKLFAS